MGSVQIISASAGSGKTYRLTQLLADALLEGEVQPEAILATTFTLRAAAELDERVRLELLTRGRPELASRMAGARLGTVNSVCGQLVTDFAFELGLSPKLQVLDEPLAIQLLSRCLTSALEGPLALELEALGSRFKEFDWKAMVRRVVDDARANGLSAEALPDCASRSATELVALFGDPEGQDASALDAALAQAMEAFLAAVADQGDDTQVTRDAAARVREGLAQLKSGRQLPWCEWLHLANLKVAKKSVERVQGLHAAAAMQDVHPRLHDDLRLAIRLVFELAQEALQRYQEEKRAWGAIDFVDQEVYALRLLSLPEVRAELASTLGLVLVDEFQDTSPLQLAIFLELSRLAPRSVWVGDQKQAIYGFRGTDPRLMDAVVAELLEGEEPETLGHSWRSRPPLVGITSAVFAPAFAAGGIPASRVTLTAARGEPSGLGAAIEHWQLEARNAAQDAAAVAAGVRELLSDPDARVRDPADPVMTRALRPGDIAVLCRSNQACLSAAEALEALGLRVALARPGLLATLEGQVAMAALRLFIDPRDSLAAVELGRALSHPEDADGLLARVLEAPKGAAFVNDPLARELAAARERFPAAGPLAAFDAVMEVAGLVERCREWGSAEVRLANLERLRAHVVAYVEAAQAEGRGATPAGLVAHLRRLANDALDEKPAHEGRDAVRVSTVHGAKGLEWPVVVLCELNAPVRGDARGVHVVDDRERPELSAPLAGRWVRYWPEPYLPQNTKAPFHERLAGCEAARAAAQAGRAEALRLLYVGWTRARDRLVLAGRGGSLELARLNLLGGGLSACRDGMVEWGGQRAPARVRNLAPADPVQAPVRPGEGPPLREPRDHPLAFRQPSACEAEGTPGDSEPLGDPLALTGRPELELLGQAVHGFLAADREGLPAAERLGLASDLLARWGVGGALRSEEVVEIGRRLAGWAKARWPGARFRREWPVAQRQPDGSLLRGIADLVLEVEEGLVLVDHKCHPKELALSQVAGHAGQLAAYAGALESATGRPVLACYVHLPLAGLMVPVALPEAARRQAG